MHTMKKTALDLGSEQRTFNSDPFQVACTAAMLMGRGVSFNGNPERRAVASGPGSVNASARHAMTLHRISGSLHRIAEAQCNFDYACPNCGGEGKAGGQFKADDCRSCAGTGSTLGKRERRLKSQAQEIATHYGLRCYFQGDPRGCSLYLLTPEIPADDYNRGYAVVRIGR